MVNVNGSSQDFRVDVRNPPPSNFNYADRVSNWRQPPPVRLKFGARDRKKKQNGWRGDTKGNFQGRYETQAEITTRESICSIVDEQFLDQQATWPERYISYSCLWSFFKKEVVGSLEIIHIHLVFRRPATIANAWLPLPPQNLYNLSTFLNEPEFFCQVDEESVLLVFVARLLVSGGICSFNL